MGRYTGPACRLCRRMGEKLFLKGERCLTPKCAIEKRGTPPGEHPSRRRRLSEFGVHLKEKQKARYIYGMMERQFRRFFDEARRRPEVTGKYLLQLLERRLDNVVFRLGFADSRRQGRQLIGHGHITVNSAITDIPSYLVRPGDVVGWREGSRKNKYYQAVAQGAPKRPVPSWLSLDAATMTAKMTSLPELIETEAKVDDRLIVEFYSK
ncbi:MAG: 30S ribosomal protein S4 [Chloroflexi bacterium]|nr:30S ribosomal protein S4 [Chloroflexota bacterium]